MTARAAAPIRESVDLAWPDGRPELLPFLPLVYVAWSDGVLSDDELDAIAGRVERQEWLDRESRAELRRWLRPDAPPSPASLESLRARLRDLGTGAGAETRRSLASLGLELARSEAGGEGVWSSDQAARAVVEIEDALGVVGHEASRKLLEGEAAVEDVLATAETPAPFDPAALHAFLDAPWMETRRRVLDLLATDDFHFDPEIDRAEYRERTFRALRVLADAGLGGLAFPEAYGGADDPGAAIAVFETLAYGDLSVLVKFGVHFGLFGGSVYQLGTERHHERWLRDVVTARLPGAYAMTETGHGSNVRDVETRARWDGDAGEFVVTTPSVRARKDWIGNAALHGRMATVFAQLEVGGEHHGVHALLVPLRDEEGRTLPGVSIEDCGAKEGLNGVDNGRIVFDDVRVPRENLLDRFAEVTPSGEYRSPIPSAGRRFFTMLGTLVAGRISIAAASVSAARTGLAIAVRYSSRRRQFGPEGTAEVPVLHYLAQQRLLLPPVATTYALTFAVRELVEAYTESLGGDAGDEDTRRVEVAAAGLKAYASRHCIDTLQASREACGGQGYLAANRFGRLKADTDVFATFEGANPVLRQLVAKGLLSRYREEMGDLKLWGVVRYLADRAQTRVTELNPVTTRKTDRDHLRDPDFHQQAFDYREERLLGSAARRLKSLIDDGYDSFDAMNRCQDHLLALSDAHVEADLLRALHRAVARAPSPALSETLRDVAALFALSRLEADRGWFLESGYFEGSKSKAVRAEVNELCWELRDQAVALVDAFGIPDDVLRAPAALGTPAAPAP